MKLLSTIDEVCRSLISGDKIHVFKDGEELPQSPISMNKGMIIDGNGEFCQNALDSRYEYRV